MKGKGEDMSANLESMFYVSNEENACAPAHSFCIIPKKFTI